MAGSFPARRQENTHRPAFQAKDLIERNSIAVISGNLQFYIQFGPAAQAAGWRSSSAFRSPFYTTRWEDIPKVKT